jgi:hypothetical protein
VFNARLGFGGALAYNGCLWPVKPRNWVRATR